MLSKTKSKAHKRVLNFESNHFPFSLNLDSIINFSTRDKRLKRINIFFDINIFLDQSTFKPRSFILLTIFISSLLDQRVSKSRSFRFFIFIDIIRR